jgi:carboxymethylenebutenolidase
MCFDANSTPPASGEPVTHATTKRRTLHSSDGAEFSAFLAQPEQTSGIGVVVLPDFRGLSPFYEQLALRLAEQGHAAIAIDYFGRTAGTGPRDKNFVFMEHAVRMKRETIDADIAAATAFLRTAEAGNCRATIALGFCFGGRQAFFSSAPHFGFAGVIGFYGAVSLYPNGAPGPLQRAAELTAPILGIFGGDDHGIPPSEVAAFDQALAAAGVEHELVTYPGAPHSFFDIKYAEHADACADAWRRVLTFISQYGATS